MCIRDRLITDSEMEQQTDEIAEPNAEDRTEPVQNHSNNSNENREEGVSPHLN